jgi:flagellar protein FliS
MIDELKEEKRVVVECYSDIIDLLKKATKAIDDSDIEKAYLSLTDARELIYCLLSSLELEDNPIAQNLFKLYWFMYCKVVEANMRKDKKSIQDILPVLRELKEGFEAVSTDVIPGGMHELSNTCGIEESKQAIAPS